MQLDLTDRESAVLRDLLHDYLPTLQREVARTEQSAMRHQLAERRDLVERLLDRIPSVRAS